MKAESHLLLGRYLVENYLSTQPRRYIRAFLMGCVEPDRNYATYLKGSIHNQWLRGHNWGNSQHYMRRVSTRLERKEQLRLLDYYNLGKLIHYTTDAFTYSHNENFGKNLRRHCTYERLLQRYFFQYLPQAPAARPKNCVSVMDAIQTYHRDYAQNPSGIENDCRYTVVVCCQVLNLMLHK